MISALVLAAPGHAGLVGAVFRALEPFEVIAGEDAGPQALAVADVNDDGRGDLLTINREDDELRAWLGRGDGSFDEPQLYLIDGTPTAIAVADLASPFGSEAQGDADGWLDVVVGSDDGEAFIFLGRGDGCFDPPEQDLSDVLDTSEVIGLVTADFDRNGRTDIAFLDLFDEVYLLCNELGNLAPCVSDLVETFGEDPIAIAGGDFNADNFYDLAVLSIGSRNLSPIFGGGDGSFTVGALQPTSADGEEGPKTLSVGRLDANDSDDIVVGNFKDFSDVTVLALYGHPEGSLTRRTFNAPVELAAAALGDLNLDANLDLLMFADDPPGLVVLAPGDGAGGFAPPVSPTGLPTASQRNVALADLNGDARLDVVALSFDGSAIQVSLNETEGCAGDCDHGGAISIDELIVAVGIALGSRPTEACPAVDTDGSGTVAISELIAAVGHALDGCQL